MTAVHATAADFPHGLSEQHARHTVKYSLALSAPFASHAVLLDETMRG